MTILIRPGRAVDERETQQPWWPLPYLLAAYCMWLLAVHLPLRFAPQSGLFLAVSQVWGVPWMEPWARQVLGAIEGLAILLLLIPACQLLGAALTLLSMTGAIVVHFAMPLTILPHQAEFVRLGEAAIAWLLALAVIWLRRHQLRRRHAS